MRAFRIGASNTVTMTAVLAMASVALLPSSEVPRSYAQALQVARPAAQSWAPAPTTSAGLRTVARAADGVFSLATEHGPVDFLPGVNLGSTLPGHQPGELAIPAEQYAAWFAQMAELRIRVVRIYTIHPPAFYTELRRYNEAHPRAPLYLMHGVYLPDESYAHGGDLYDPDATEAFRQELRDAVAAVHGDLDRDPQPGRAAGYWRDDVSPWLVGWIVGAEWDPAGVAGADQRDTAQPATAGKYVTAVDGATPTERWLAARLDELASAEAERGRSVPVAFVNWPTTDPLPHPEEPAPEEDRVGIDANHITTTGAWPGGQFASYHAYPNYPDFQWHEPGLAGFQYNGRSDPYAGYLDALRRHHAEAGIPVLVTEFGVPSSIGAAHRGPLGRDQGDHSERQAMETDAELLRMIKDLGLGGGIVFSWADEWFKASWNTRQHQIPVDRRAFWHDALTNEQFYGLLATDPAGRVDLPPADLGGGPGVTAASARTDPGYLYLDIRLAGGTGGPVTVALDPVAGLTGAPAPGSTDGRADVALVLDPAARTGRLWIRTEIDPLRLDGTLTDGTPAANGGTGPAEAPAPGWRPPRLLLDRGGRVPTSGEPVPAAYQDLSTLRWGTWDPAAADFDSRALWRVDAGALRIRLPWAMVGMTDPSSRYALLPSAADHTAPASDGIGLSVTAGGATAPLRPVTWRGWDLPGYSARLKAGTDVLRDAFVAVS